jgi:hypothetical protein
MPVLLLTLPIAPNTSLVTRHMTRCGGSAHGRYTNPIVHDDGKRCRLPVAPMKQQHAVPVVAKHAGLKALRGSRG